MKIVKAKKLKYIPASHEDKNNPGVFKKILFENRDFIDGKIQMINWAKLPVHKTFRQHYHEDMEEIFIVLKGKVTILIDQEKIELKKGDAVLVPMNKAHKMSNTGNTIVEYIVIGISLGKGGKTVVV
ncbi:MAG: cupin domain-containing protein [Patescibacteria group bacterium]|nr:cupin domain-containing protein [Patescibacteria group bacterium]